HTDNVPIAPEHRDEFADNQALSEARAKSVAEYLAQRLGLAPAQIGWRGMADRQPIASNATEAGRAQNRRTEIVIEGYRPKRVLETDLETVWADGQGEALGDWSVDGRPKPKYRPAPVPKAPDPTDLDAWFAQAPVGKAAWLYPTENARPAIPATHVLIAHPAGTTVELRLGDRAVSRLAFEGAKKRRLVAISHWRNVHLEEGENRFVAIVRDKQGREIARLVRTVEFAGEPVAARWLPERTKAAADGVSEPVIAVRFFDRRGRPAREGMVGEFTVDPPYRPADRMPEDGMPTPQAKGRFVIGKDGVALIALAPTTTPGEATLRFALADREETVRAWIEPAAREWILVGFAEGSVGYDRIRGAMQPIGQGRGERKIWKNGRAAFYAKGRIQGKTLLTLAYDTAKTQGRNPTGHAGAIDPNRWYTVYGDASGQQFDAPSSHKLYLKLERDAFYALYGDFDTGLDHTELGRYARRLTGAKAALHGERAGFTAFATRTGRTKARDEIPGRGISGLYRLGQRNIVVGSERIWIETRDRLHPEHVLDRRLLSPHLDYDIDYLAGTVFFKQPVPAHDASLNPVFIVAEYETDGTTSQFTTAGGRAYLRAGEGGALEVGASAVQEGRPGKDDRLLGVDATYQPTPTLTLRAEAAQSETADFGRRRAWKVEGIVAQDAIRGRLYLRDVADGFGLGQVQGSENGARRAGLEGEWRINAHWRVRADLSATKLATTGAQRRMAAASVERREERWQARAGVRTVRDRLPQAAARRSDQLTAGATARVGERLTLGVDHEQTLNASRASSEFPTRTALRADWQLSPEAVLSLTEEWAYAAGTRVRTTRIGARTQLWEGAEMRSGYEHRLGEQGARAVANVGLQQRLHLDDAWALDLGFDRVKTLRGAHPRALNPNAPGVFGEGDYTVYSFGVGYTPEDWVANLRVDRRLGQNTRAWAGQASIQGRPLEALAAMGSLQFASEWGAGGVRNDQTLATLGAAWRPQADGWVWLVRLDLDWRRQRSAGVAHQRALRWIANLGANWRPAPDWELQLTLGGKRSDARFDALAISGYAGLASAELLYDLTDRWLLAMQGTGLWAAGMRRYSYGLGVDYALSEQLLVGLGFNADGFFDPDFVASRYTMRGVYLRMRAKFDQSDLAGMLKGF
ncbi:MAG: OmpA family protein, partial [Zetaproteobacteria bacterium]